jgi:hypothetical protein
MGDCELIEKCMFFNDTMANMPGTAASFKRQYCREDSSSCARYRAFKALGREKVPPDLFPNQVDKVDQIIAAG